MKKKREKKRGKKKEKGREARNIRFWLRHCLPGLSRNAGFLYQCLNLSSISCVRDSVFVSYHQTL